MQMQISKKLKVNANLKLENVCLPNLFSIIPFIFLDDDEEKSQKSDSIKSEESIKKANDDEKTDETLDEGEFLTFISIQPLKKMLIIVC